MSLNFHQHPSSSTRAPSTRQQRQSIFQPHLPPVAQTPAPSSAPFISSTTATSSTAGAAASYPFSTSASSASASTSSSSLHLSPAKQRQYANLDASLALLDKQLADTRNLVQMTAAQAGDVRFLGGYVGGLFMGASKVLGEEGIGMRRGEEEQEEQEEVEED